MSKQTGEDEHQVILNYMAEGNAQAAQQAMEQHIQENLQSAAGAVITYENKNTI